MTPGSTVVDFVSKFGGSTVVDFSNITKFVTFQRRVGPQQGGCTVVDFLGRLR